MSAEKKERLWTTKDVAEYLQVSTSKVRRWTREGKLKAIPLSDGPKARKRYEPSEVRRFVNQRGGSSE